MQLTVLIGLPATGKSTWADSQEWDALLSSDRYRLLMFGDEHDQSHNDEVFTKLYHDMNELLSDNANEHIVFDATNLNAKRRKRVLELGHKYGAHAHAVFFTEPLDVILQRNSGRNRRVPEDSIRQKYKTLHVPLVTEAWDSVEYVGEPGKWWNDIEHIADIDTRYWIGMMSENSRLADMRGFDQCNPHHTKDLWDHTMAVVGHLHKHKADWRVQLAALYHDVGKLDTQTVDSDGVGHYYGHQYVSAQIAIQELRQILSSHDMMYISTLIHYHMDMYNHKTLADAAKLARRLNSPKLLHDLILLHEADVAAH